MTEMLISFSFGIDHGCLIVGDAVNFDDTSEWDPGEGIWRKFDNSVIFGVLPAVDGEIECRVQIGGADIPAGGILLSEELSIPSGKILISDPIERLRVQADVGASRVKLDIYVNDFEFASEVAIVVSCL